MALPARPIGDQCCCVDRGKGHVHHTITLIAFISNQNIKRTIVCLEWCSFKFLNGQTQNNNCFGHFLMLFMLDFYTLMNLSWVKSILLVYLGFRSDLGIVFLKYAQQNLWEIVNRKVKFSRPTNASIV